VLFLNISLDSFTNHYSKDKKAENKLILLFTIENSKIITNTSKIGEFYQGFLKEKLKKNPIFFRGIRDFEPEILCEKPNKSERNG